LGSTPPILVAGEVPPLKAGLNPSSLAGLRLRSRLVHFLTLSDTGSHWPNFLTFSHTFSYFRFTSAQFRFSPLSLPSRF
jgi:hypothetical protein